MKREAKMYNTEARIVRNSICTPDGTVLVSRHVHDYVTYTDKNGKEYMVDGGNDYLRRNVHDDAPYEETSIYSDAPHETLRAAVTWGRRLDSGVVYYLAIKHMSKAHINNIIADGYTGSYVDIMKAELLWRDEHESKSEAKRLEAQREANYG